MKNSLKFTLLLFSIVTINGCSQDAALIKKYLNAKGEGLYGSIMVADRIIFFELYYKKAPLTVSNFVGLAEGKFAEGIERKGNFFDGIIFHRVVDNFVIQGGDPTGTGTGGPGYSFPDEFGPDLKHDAIGILSMANSGPNTNGSQFFITLAPTPHLDNKHSVFGKVLDGLDVLPLVVQKDQIQKVKIYARGKDAKAFLDGVTWQSFKAKIDEIKAANNKKLEEEKAATISALKANTNFKVTKEGIYYELQKTGKGAQIKNGDNVEVHYELKIYGKNETIDSSYLRKETFSVPVGAGQVIPGWEIILLELKVGDKAHVVIPPELAYGERGAGGIIPPNAYLDFIIEVISKK